MGPEPYQPVLHSLPDVKHEPCPKCQAMLPVYDGFKTWCDHCGWNLEASRSPGPRSILEKLYASHSRKLSQGLFDEMLKSPDIRVGPIPLKLLAFAIAGLVHSISLALLALGIWLGGFAFPYNRVFGAVLGIGCLMFVGLLLLPSIPQTSAAPLPRERYPALHQLANRVARALNGPPVDVIRYDMRFNASFGQFGWGRKRTLILGLPLVAVLNEKELVALLGHELAHGVNGDPARSFMIGSALRALSAWYDVVNPAKRWELQSGPAPFLLVIVNVVCLPITGLIWLLGYALTQLIFADKQRSEYLADRLAAQAAGTDPMLTLLGKLLLTKIPEITLKAFYLAHRSWNYFSALKQQVGRVPEREMERLHRVERMSEYRVDFSHPPTSHRVELLQAYPIPEASVALSPAEVAQLERELVSLLDSTQQWMTGMDPVDFRETFKFKL